jgi:hypothetical protein
MTREEAKAAGTFYDDDVAHEPCGTTKRYTSNGACVACSKAPEVKAARKARDERPEAKAARRARESTPEYKAAAKASRERPEAKAAKKAREATLEYKAADKARHKTRYEIPENKHAHLYRTAKNRAKGKKGHHRPVLFTISREYFNAKVVVGTTNWKDKMGFPFQYTRPLKGRQNPYGPSLDQIIPGNGYTPENIQVVPLFWNVFKGDHFSEAEAMDVNIRMTIAFCKNSARLRQHVANELGLMDVPASREVQIEVA